MPMLDRFRKLWGASPDSGSEEACRKADAEVVRGRLAEAAAGYQAVLLKDSGHWDAKVGLANISLQAGELHKAVSLYEELLVLRPDFAVGHYKKANAHNRLNQLAAALDGYNAAISLDADYAVAHCNRGTVLERLNRLPEALGSYDRAIELDARDAFAHYNRATVLKSLARREEALRGYDQAIALDGSYLEAHINRGLLLQELARYEDALTSFDRAIQLSRGLIEAWQGRATCLLSLKRLTEAIAAFGEVLSLNPEQPYVRGLRRYAQMHLSDWRDYGPDLQSIRESLAAGKKVITPFASLLLFDSPELQLLAAEIWAADKCVADPPLGQIARRPPGPKIRVGYFSPDFHAHPVASLLLSVLDRHDRSQFELVGFDFGPVVHDQVRERLQTSFDQFVDTRGLTDRELALLARDMGIDVAVDLAGFTEHNRAPVFAFRAAPVQLSYLGYPGTTGMSAMDYFLGDLEVAPPARQSAYSESLVHIEPCALPLDRSAAAGLPVPSRAALGLPSKGFVFCCFNNAYKLNPTVFDVWMRILRQVDSSVLWLSWSSDLVAENLRREAMSRGVDAERLIFARRTELHADHLARLRAADLFLDTSPYSAHATAVDALSAGLALLTCRGGSFASRIPASLLMAAGVPELVTDDLSSYEALAIRLAADAAFLADLTHRLGSRHFSTLDQYVASIERVYRRAVSETAQRPMA